MKLIVKIGDHEIGRPVPIEVPGVDPHAGPGHAFRVEGHIGLEARVFEGSVRLVEQEEIGCGVGGHQQILPAVGIGINAHHAEGAALKPANARGVADVVKGAAAPVSVQPGPAGSV